MAGAGDGLFLLFISSSITRTSNTYQGERGIKLWVIRMIRYGTNQVLILEIPSHVQTYDCFLHSLFHDKKDSQVLLRTIPAPRILYQ
jgi:hypothetical protein